MKTEQGKMNNDPLNLLRIMYYRGVEILNRDFNLAFGKLIVPFMKLGISIAWIISFFALVRLSSDLDIICFLMVCSVVVGAPILLFPISTIMSKLYENSVQFRPNMLLRIPLEGDTRARKYAELQLKACSVIRCQVGGLYQMEAKAKLTLFHQVVTGIVCLLVNVKV